jgi:hypothetical protein
MLTRFNIGTLGALALGVFCSCSTDEVADPFAQDRNISAIDLPEIDSLVNDSIQKGLYPDSLSGWELHWSPPFDAGGTPRVYILGDSLLDQGRIDALKNGAGDFDFGAAGIAPPLAILTIRDTVWKIPSSLFAGKGHSGRGRDLRADTVYWFSVWVRYADGAVGAPVRCRFFLGDEFPPEIPEIDTVVGQTFFQIDFDRPRDMIGRFDETFQGRIDSIRAIWWKGTRIKDSAATAKSRPETLFVPESQLRDTSVHRFRLTLSGMPYETPHLVLLQFFDSVGNRSSLGPFPVKTRDARVPASARGGGSAPLSSNKASVSWSAATDSFANGAYQYAVANHRIGSYRVLLSTPPGSKFRAVDSIDVGTDSTSFRPGSSWPKDGLESRFRWDGTAWTWTWPNFTPGDSFRVGIVVRDKSGNPAPETLFVAGSTPPVAGVVCPHDRPVVAVKGTDSLGDFCIERFEHAVGGKVAHDVTWAQAIQGCKDAGGFLCSEAQWQHACETEPGSSVRHTYGALEVGVDSDIDSAIWLRDVCAGGTARADTAATFDTTRRDPRCISAWGVRDMPGHVAEWTRDVWFSKRDTLAKSRLDPWSLAYLDTSDYTGKADHGVLRGGSWIDLGNLTLSKTLSGCRNRTYAAFSSWDTLSSGERVRTPNPSGKARSFGYRCCYKPLQ